MVIVSEAQYGYCNTRHHIYAQGRKKREKEKKASPKRFICVHEGEPLQVDIAYIPMAKNWPLTTLRPSAESYQD